MAVSEKQKWIISLYSAVLFVLLVNPIAFRITNYFLGFIGLDTLDIRTGKPTLSGILIHSILFGLIVRLSMGVNIERFSGLSPPFKMLECNKAQLLAIQNNSPICENASSSCIKNPYSINCLNNLTSCNNDKSTDLFVRTQVMNSCDLRR